MRVASRSAANYILVIILIKSIYIIMKTDTEIRGFIIGLIFIIFIVKIIKRILKIPRPIMNELSTYGMPSTRSASLFFIITYIYLTNKNLKMNTILILILCVIIACSLKFILKEHSLIQLLAGGILGIIIANIVYKITKIYK